METTRRGFTTNASLLVAGGLVCAPILWNDARTHAPKRDLVAATTTVQTARGPVDSSQLGRVLVHEHIFTMNPDYAQNYRTDFNEEVQVAAAARKLNELKAAGIDTIIDLTVLGLGRFIPRLMKVAERTELNIIVATGCYTFNDVPHPLRNIGPDVPDPLTDLFVRDIEVGIGATAVRAAAIKCAIDAPGQTQGVERVMRAAAAANVRTGVPITVHTAAKLETGLIAQDILAKHGVDLRDVIIGHSGDTTDIDYLMRLADRGSILGMDRFGMDVLLTLRERVSTIVELVRRGYADRIALSHDYFVWTDMVIPNDYRARHLPEHSYLYISRKVVPALLEAGITRRQVDMMLIDNPRRHFEGAANRQHTTRS